MMNSLYPFIMKTCKLSYGSPKEISLQQFNLNNFYGFLDVKVMVPENIKIPVLPIQPHKGEDGIKIYPTGISRNVYFSEELKLAVAHGCKIVEIYKAYSYKSTYLFKKFVNTMYTLRLQQKNPLYEKL